MTSDGNGGTLHLPGRVGGAGSIAVSPVVRLRIRATPNIRNVYYCSFPEAALPPEFSKRRPVIVVSYKNSLSGPILVVPITTQPQREGRWSVKLARNPTPGESCDVWAVCNHLYTVSCERLTATHGVVPRLTAEEFRPVHALIMKWLPALDPGEDVP